MYRFILIAFFFCLSSLSIGAEQFIEGTHYHKLKDAKPGSGTKVDVIEFFNYACPHCNNLEPFVEKWKKEKSEAISFQHIPAYWNPLFENTAKAFYTAEALAVSDKMHTKLFDAIHGKRLDFNNVNVIKSVFTEAGVDGTDFDKQFKSFFVQQKLSMGNKLFTGYRLKSVPVFVIDGQWRTSLQDAGSPENMFAIIDMLSKKVLSSR